jgi:hypothetical protein
MPLFKILGVLFALFVVLFIAIIVEESFVGGRRRRRLQQKAREAQQQTDMEPRWHGESPSSAPSGHLLPGEKEKPPSFLLWERGING